MRRHTAGLTIGCLALTGALSLAGCERQGPYEEAGEDIDEAIEEAGDELEKLGDQVEDATDPDRNGGA